MTDPLSIAREALEEVIRVFDSNPSAIVDTVWVAGDRPETLYDHCSVALAALDAAAQQGCTRSHPHENMNEECERKTVRARCNAQQEPFGYFHELLNHDGNGNGVWLGSKSKEVTEKSHIDGETSKQIIALYSTQPTRQECCVPDDNEPSFVLLGRDPQAPALVEQWAAERERLEPVSGKPTQARAIAAQMKKFKAENPNKGLPTCIENVENYARSEDVYRKADVSIHEQPFAYFQWNSGWNHWEEVIASAAGQDGVVAAYRKAAPSQPVISDDSVSMACEIGDYGLLEPRQMATVIFQDKKIAECYSNEDAKFVLSALLSAQEKK